MNYCGVQKWLRFSFYYLRDIYRNCFTGLGRLGNIYRNSGRSTESERWQPALRGTPRITGLALVRIIYRRKLQDRAFLEIINNNFELYSKSGLHSRSHFWITFCFWPQSLFEPLSASLSFAGIFRACFNLAERIFRGFLFLSRWIFSRILSADLFSSFLWEKCPKKSSRKLSLPTEKCFLANSFLQVGAGPLPR